MPFGVVSWLGPRMRQVDRNGDHSMARGNFGGEYGHPIVTIGELCSCVNVCEAIKLLFGVVSRVGPGIDVFDGGPVHIPKGEG